MHIARKEGTGQRKTCRISDEPIKCDQPGLKIDRDPLTLPVAIADRAQFLVMPRGSIQGIGLRHRRAFRQVLRRLHMRGALAVIGSHVQKPFDCGAVPATPYSCMACYLGRKGVEDK